MNPLLRRQLLDFDLDAFRPIIKRDLDLGEAAEPRCGNLVTAVIGMRRSGKSYRLFQEMERLINSGIESERILYFNFEDERFAPVVPRFGDEVLEAHMELFPDAHKKGLYLFFDEIQAMDNWGAWLRRIVDTKRATIFVTGSSSQLLSSEISTAFRGRAIDLELLPYSFREFCRARGSVADPLRMSATDDMKTKTLLFEYLECGGFPAAIDLPEAKRNLLLQSYVERVYPATSSSATA